MTQITPAFREIIFKQLSIHEGLRLNPYRDTKGYWTIGIGHCIDPKITGDEYSFDHFMSNGCSNEEAMNLFNRDLNNVIYQLDRRIVWWPWLDEIYQRILIDMCFNLGINGLCNFKRMLDHLSNFNYEAAADEMMYQDGRTKNALSDWYKETGSRSRRLVKWMREGIESWS